MDKRNIFDQIIAALHEAQLNAERARDAAQAEANQHVGRMESRYDTFREEAQYEVEAQEKQIRAYEEGIRKIKELLDNPAGLEPAATARVGSIVTLRTESGDERQLVLAPAGGGILVENDGISITVITRDAPLGAQIIGHSVSDPCGAYVIHEIA